MQNQRAGSPSMKMKVRAAHACSTARAARASTSRAGSAAKTGLFRSAEAASFAGIGAEHSTPTGVWVWDGRARGAVR